MPVRLFPPLNNGLPLKAFLIPLCLILCMCVHGTCMRIKTDSPYVLDLLTRGCFQQCLRMVVKKFGRN